MQNLHTRRLKTAKMAKVTIILSHFRNMLAVKKLELNIKQ